MRWLLKLGFRAQPIFRRGKIEAELADEIRAHLELATDAHVAAGLSPAEARRTAQREFGGMEQIKEAYRDERGLSWVAHLRQDLCFGARVMRTQRGWTSFIVLSLGLGIGVNLVLFAVVNAMLFRTLPGVTEPDRLIHLPLGHSIRFAEYAYSREHQTAFSDLAASAPLRAPIAIRGVGDTPASDAPALSGIGPVQMVTANYFSVLGAGVAQGRIFQPTDELTGMRPVIILSERLWTARFGADPHMVGKTILLNNLPFTVVGITRDIHPLEPGMFIAPSAWLPITWADALDPALGGLESRGPNVSVIGRLKPHVTFDNAQTELRQLETQFAEKFPARDSASRGSWADALQAGYTFLAPDMRGLRPFLGVLFVLGGVILVVTCANVASLLLARGMARDREFWLRAALGASRGRMIRQLMTESLMLGLMGGFFGLVAGTWFARWLWPLILRVGDSPETAAMFGLDWRVGAQVLVTAVVAVSCFGGWPALQLSKQPKLDPRDIGVTPGRISRLVHLFSPAGGVGRSRHRAPAVRTGNSVTLWQRLLVGGQFTVAVICLGAATLLARMIANNAALPLAFDPARIAFFELSAPRGSDAARYPVDFQRALLLEIRDLPGVEAATLGEVWHARALDPDSLRIDGQPVRTPAGLFRSRVTPDYFAAIGLTIREGRNFTRDEMVAGQTPVIVSQTFANRHWPRENPLGHHLQIAEHSRQSVMSRRGQREDSGGIDGTVVGVVDDGIGAIRNRHAYRPLAGDIYTVLGSADPVLPELWVRTSGESAALDATIIDRARRLDAHATLWPRGHLSRILDDWRGETAVASSLIGTLGGITLLLAAIGTFGVVSYSVAQRTHEIGIRMAVGASKGAITRLTLRDTFRCVGWGVACGAIICAGISWWSRLLLYRIHPFDPLVFAGIPLLLVLVVFIACWIPVRHATSVDPVVALRHG